MMQSGTKVKKHQEVSASLHTMLGLFVYCFSWEIYPHQVSQRTSINARSADTARWVESRILISLDNLNSRSKGSRLISAFGPCIESVMIVYYCCVNGFSSVGITHEEELRTLLGPDPPPPLPIHTHTHNRAIFNFYFEVMLCPFHK